MPELSGEAAEAHSTVEPLALAGLSSCDQTQGRTMSEDTPLFKLTPEEMDRMERFAKEALQKTIEIRSLFTPDTRGMMLCLYTMNILNHHYPSMFRVDATTRIAEWMAAGEPEDLKQVVPRIMERAKKEVDEAGRQSGANWN